MSKKRESTGWGWAWVISEGMCHWVEPSRGSLTRRSKPSPEAKPVHVAIVPMKLWRRALKALEHQQEASDAD